MEKQSTKIDNSEPGKEQIRLQAAEHRHGFRE
jgi:hypothetical protein